MSAEQVAPSAFGDSPFSFVLFFCGNGLTASQVFQTSRHVTGLSVMVERGAAESSDLDSSLKAAENTMIFSNCSLFKLATLFASS